MEEKQQEKKSKRQKTVRFFVIVFICHIIGFGLIWLAQHFLIK